MRSCVAPARAGVFMGVAGAVGAVFTVTIADVLVLGGSAMVLADELHGHAGFGADLDHVLGVHLEGVVLRLDLVGVGLVQMALPHVVEVGAFRPIFLFVAQVDNVVNAITLLEFEGGLTTA